MRSLKYILIFILLIFIVTEINAQRKTKKKKEMVKSIGGGFSGGDFGGIGAYGGCFMYDFRKPLTKGKAFNVSFDNHIAIFAGAVELSNKTSFTILPTIATSVNINAGAGTTRKATSPVGGFFGVGIMAMPSPPRSASSGNVSVTVSGDFGPYFNIGFRIKRKKTSYIGVKFFGGYTVFYEAGYGGVCVLFPRGLAKKKKRF